ncbi:MAG: hypothetical protein ACOYD1_07970 [Candidatus Nanopelagicales bacterium]
MSTTRTVTSQDELDAAIADWPSGCERETRERYRPRLLAWGTCASSSSQPGRR